MKRLLVDLFVGVLVALAIVGGYVSLTGNPPANVTAATTYNYGSGYWSGPTTSVIQDPGWANSSLKVGMAGDSITYRCAPQLRAIFAANGVSFAIRAHSGQNTAGTNDWARTLTKLPDIYVDATGSNDAMDPFAMPAQIERTKEITAGATLLWVDTYVGRPAYLADDIRNSGQVNGYVHAALPPNQVISWVANLAAVRRRGLPLSYYVQDGIHPWPKAENGHGDGCAVFAQVVFSGVRPFL